MTCKTALLPSLTTITLHKGIIMPRIHNQREVFHAVDRAFDLQSNYKPLQTDDFGGHRFNNLDITKTKPLPSTEQAD